MRGPAWLLTAIGLWSVLDANSKLLAGAYGAGQVLGIRHAVLLLLVLGLRALRPGAGGTMTTAHPALHAIRAVAMLGSAAGFFLAMREMSMAEAYLVHFTAPFMMLGLAALALGEPMPARAWGWTAIGFAGVAVAIAPSIGAGGHWQGYAWAGFGAACYAVIMTVNRRLREEQGLAAVILWPSLLGLVATLPFAAAEWVAPTPRDMLLLALNGVVAGAAMLAMSLAFRHANAARLAPFEYTALLFALGFDLALWGRLPALATLAGAAIVVAACIASERARSVARATARQAPPSSKARQLTL
ncbi:DMT family transporter [Plastoroseomonas hellenica]|uniref:DMT family transporter n=1 Tax=Plastoroseomonas hellenica TaxID=2687306 RepID=A0ABS5F497_9PROT|nr:DMT family transporter [Plastoroseomonas hellenica]MBR0644984.1 DMT family transporter [Plastoroseomonas hellenica]MBR0667348.1 DMT family transporter [Plastoroseomonas hellenica]